MVVSGEDPLPTRLEEEHDAVGGVGSSVVGGAGVDDPIRYHGRRLVKEHRVEGGHQGGGTVDPRSQFRASMSAEHPMLLGRGQVQCGWPPTDLTKKAYWGHCYC